MLLVASTASAHSVINLLSDGAYRQRQGHPRPPRAARGRGGPPRRRSTTNIDVISSLELSGVTEGGIADLAIHGGHAYLNAWGGAGTCGRNGVHVVDIADLENPVEVAFIQAKEGSYPGEGAQVLSLGHPVVHR